MSHFTVLVIGEDVEEQLAPYDENIVVPRYVKYTKEQLIKKGREDIAQYEKGTYAEYLKDPVKYAERCSNPRHLRYLKNEFPKMLKWNDEQIYQNELRWYEKKDIGAEGEVYSTYNPKSKWDWYQIGGRWAGMLILKKGAKSGEKGEQSLLDKSSPYAKGGVDSALKKDIDFKKTTKKNKDPFGTYAVVKNGEWFQKGEMGWWGMSSETEEESIKWDEGFFKNFIKPLSPDTKLTIVDCHI